MSAVYMQQERGMRACNNSNMRNRSLLLFIMSILRLQSRFTHLDPAYLFPPYISFLMWVMHACYYCACSLPLSCWIYTALIPCLAAYILPSSPVLMHTCTCIYCPHPLSCCAYTALIPCLAAYTCILPSSSVLLHIYCTCFSTFWHCHPYILQHFMEMFYSLYLDGWGRSNTKFSICHPRQSVTHCLLFVLLPLLLLRLPTQAK